MSYTCPLCGAISHNPHDAEHRYCGRCHRFADDPYEFVCVECGRHIVAIGPRDSEVALCAICIFMPGWFRDPKLRDILDRDVVPPAHERDAKP